MSKPGPKPSSNLDLGYDLCLICGHQRRQHGNPTHGIYTAPNICSEFKPSGVNVTPRTGESVGRPQSKGAQTSETVVSTDGTPSDDNGRGE